MEFAEDMSEGKTIMSSTKMYITGTYGSCYSGPTKFLLCGIGEGAVHCGGHMHGQM